MASPFADESGRATPPRQSLVDGAGVRRGADGRRGRCALPYGERIPRRVNRRDGYRERDWDTGVGSIELAVPKLPAGSYFPDWLSTVLSHESRAFGNTTLGGVAAREFQNRCPVHDVIRCRRAAPRPRVHLPVRLAALGLRSVRPTQLRRGSARVPIYLEIARGIPERRNSHDAKPGSQSRQELPQRSAHQPWRKKLELGSLTQSSRGRRKSRSHYREVQSRRK